MRVTLQEAWDAMLGELCARLGAVRPKLPPKKRVQILEQAKSRMAVQAPYTDDFLELKGAALTAFEGLSYDKRSTYWSGHHASR